MAETKQSFDCVVMEYSTNIFVLEGHGLHLFSMNGTSSEVICTRQSSRASPCFIFTMTQRNVLPLVSFVGVLFSGCFASLPGLRQSCLPDANGIVKCSFSKADILPLISVRQTCGLNEYGCSCVRAVQYNNEIRAKHGLGPVSIGSASMLDNAIQHSISFVSGPFQHQILDKATADIKCGIFCTGENIAKFSGKSDDPAKKCMDIWENSPGHLSNILGASSMTVVGIHEQSGITYCTQTFGVRHSGNNAKSGSSCEPVTSNPRTGTQADGPNHSFGGSVESAAPSPSPSPSPSQSPSQPPYYFEVDSEPSASGPSESNLTLLTEYGSSQATVFNADVTPCAS
jgi:hypothetical protein